MKGSIFVNNVENDDDLTIDEMLSRIATDGIIMSPETIKLKSMELNREYSKFEQEMMEINNIDTDEITDSELIETKLMVYKTWIGHKLSVYELTLGKILDALNGE